MEDGKHDLGRWRMVSMIWEGTWRMVSMIWGQMEVRCDQPDEFRVFDYDPVVRIMDAPLRHQQAGDGGEHHTYRTCHGVHKCCG